MDVVAHLLGHCELRAAGFAVACCLADALFVAPVDGLFGDAALKLGGEAGLAIYVRISIQIPLTNRVLIEIIRRHERCLLDGQIRHRHIHLRA